MKRGGEGTHRLDRQVNLFPSPDLKKVLLAMKFTYILFKPHGGKWVNNHKVTHPSPTSSYHLNYGRLHTAGRDGTAHSDPGDLEWGGNGGIGTLRFAFEIIEGIIKQGGGEVNTGLGIRTLRL